MQSRGSGPGMQRLTAASSCARFSIRAVRTPVSGFLYFAYPGSITWFDVIHSAGGTCCANAAGVA
eukprot:4339509-Prymnesium_polylepis.2